MNQKKTAQRRFGVLILLSLLLHVGVFLSINWRGLFAPEVPAEPREEPESVTRRITLAPRIEPEPEPVPESVEPEAEAAAPKPPADPVVTQQNDPEPLKESEPAPDEHMPVSNAEEAGSNNQTDRNAGQIVYGADKPVSEPAVKPGDVKKQEAETPAQEQTVLPLPDSDKTVLEPGAQDQSDVAQQARDGGKANRTLTTGSERALWSVPGSDEQAGESKEQKRASKSGETDASGNQDRTTDPTLSPEKQALRKRVEEDLKALFGENFSRETHKVEKLEEVDIPDLETPGEGEQALGNLNMLTDPQLREVGVEQPFSEKESEELRVANMILERITRQIRQHLVNPYKGEKNYRGVVIFKLDRDGYLQDAYVYRSSGLILLDISVLDAIRAVKRYDVPSNKIIAERYYSSIAFEYSTNSSKFELMPFERDGKKKDEKAKSGAKESKDNTNKTAKNTRSQQTDPKHANTKETP